MHMDRILVWLLCILSVCTCELDDPFNDPAVLFAKCPGILPIVQDASGHNSKTLAPHSLLARNPLLLHVTGPLPIPLKERLQREIQQKATQCRTASFTNHSLEHLSLHVPFDDKPLEPHGRKRHGTSPTARGTIRGLPEDGAFIAGPTQGFLIDSGLCAANDFFQVFMSSDSARVRVRVNPVGHGLSLAFFRATAAGVYNVTILHQQAPPPTFQQPQWPVIKETLLQTWDVTVREPVATETDGACDRGLRAGTWLRGSSCQSPDCGQDWHYVPYGCQLQRPGGEGAWACLDRKWVLFHGDSTVEEDAIGFVKHVLRGNTPMQKKRRRDAWRVFDVLVFANGTVRPVYVKPGADWLLLLQGVPGPAVRVTMRFNGSPVKEPKIARKDECWGAKTYTHACVLVAELYQQFKGPSAPDVLVFNTLMWDMVCHVQVTKFRALMHRIGKILRIAHALSPGTRFIYRTNNAIGRGYRHRLVEGAHRAEPFLQAALETVLQHPFLNIVDMYDVTQPWSMTPYAGDGHHYSSLDEGLVPFVYHEMLQVLLHAICA